MAKKVNDISIISVAVIGILISAMLFANTLLTTGHRSISKVENIYGIPYPQINGVTTISEDLAHADIYLKEPVLFKKMNIAVTFDPKDSTTLTLGIRENDFWLSYDKVSLYDQRQDIGGLQTKNVTIPITDKFQETDQSLDMMIFAEGNPVEWELHNIQATIDHDEANPSKMKQYIASIIRRERAQ